MPSGHYHRSLDEAGHAYMAPLHLGPVHLHLLHEVASLVHAVRTKQMTLREVRSLCGIPKGARAWLNSCIESKVDQDGLQRVREFRRAVYTNVKLALKKGTSWDAHLLSLPSRGLWQQTSRQRKASRTLLLRSALDIRRSLAGLMPLKSSTKRRGPTGPKAGRSSGKRAATTARSRRQGHESPATS